MISYKMFDSDISNKDDKQCDDDVAGKISQNLQTKFCKPESFIRNLMQ